MRLALRLGLVLLAVHAAGAANVRAINFEGFRKVALGAIRRDLPLRPGQEYTKQDVDKAKDWLLSQGLFINVTTDVQEQGQIVDVTFKATENPDVAEVRFEGNTQVASAALRQDLGTLPRRILNRRVLAHDALLVGNAYLAHDMRVVVETAYDAEPTDPNKPVVVIFKITELKIGQVKIEPLRYTRRDKLEPLIVLKKGDLLEEGKLQEQGRRLGEAGLFTRVDPPATSDPAPDGTVDVTFGVDEPEYPLVTRQLLDVIDLPNLAHTIRFNAVDVAVEPEDFELAAGGATPQQRLEAARKAAEASPRDTEAQYRLYAATRWLGDAHDAAEHARTVLEPAVQAGGTPLQHLRLGQVLFFLDDLDHAAAELKQAIAAPETRYAGLLALLEVRLAGLRDRRPESADALRETVLQGLGQLAALPPAPSLAAVTDGFHFYYTAITLSLLNLNIREPLRLDGPAAQRLVGSIYDLVAGDRTAAEKRHLGRMLTAVGFAAQAAGLESDRPAVWAEFAKLLRVSQQELVGLGVDQTSDPTASFYLGLTDLLLDDLAAARQVAMQGLKRFPASERLVDLYLLSCLQGRTGNNDTKVIDLLRESISDVQKRLAGQELAGWGPLMLLAKLQLALRDTLAPAATTEREQARQAAEAAARNAATIRPEAGSGWWILGMAQLKGPQPGAALASYQKVADLQPKRPGVAYALALARLVAGDVDTGLKAMAALAQPG